MSHFYMLAGTIHTQQTLQQILQMLDQAGLKGEIVEDEIELEGEATVYLRSGFEHEYILVGDSSDRETLISETQQLSEILKSNQIPHGYEIYDRENQMIDEFEFST